MKPPKKAGLVHKPGRDAEIQLMHQENMESARLLIAAINRLAAAMEKRA